MLYFAHDLFWKCVVKVINQLTEKIKGITDQLFFCIFLGNSLRKYHMAFKCVISLILRLKPGMILVNYFLGPYMPVGGSVMCNMTRRTTIGLSSWFNYALCLSSVYPGLSDCPFSKFCHTRL